MVSTAITAHLGSLLFLCHHPTTSTLQHAHMLLWQADKPRIIHVGHQDAGSELSSLTPTLTFIVFIIRWGPKIHLSFVLQAGIIPWAVPRWRVPLGLPGEQTEPITLREGAILKRRTCTIFCHW